MGGEMINAGGIWIKITAIFYIHQHRNIFPYTYLLQVPKYILIVFNIPRPTEIIIFYQINI